MSQGFRKKRFFGWPTTTIVTSKAMEYGDAPPQEQTISTCSSDGSHSNNRVFISSAMAQRGGLLETSGATTVTSDDNSENERPPVDFQVASDSEESDSENFDQLMMTSPSSNSGVFLADQVRCPLCERWKRKFTCRECLLKGDFYLSNPNKIPPPVLLMEGTSKASSANSGWKDMR